MWNCAEVRPEAELSRPFLKRLLDLAVMAPHRGSLYPKWIYTLDEVSVEKVSCPSGVRLVDVPLC
jgi:hypothetical protein